MPHKSQTSLLRSTQKNRALCSSAMENWFSSACADFNYPFQLSSDSSQYLDFPPWPVEGIVVEDRSLASSSRSHSQAEKRRRDRINAQLAALRKLIPKSDKMDKAALLVSTVEHLKDLKEKTVEIYETDLILPTEVDEVTVDYVSVCPENGSSVGGKCFIKASVCCEDRPEVLGELMRVIKGLKLNTVKADISSVGGRMRSNLILCSKNGEDGVALNTLRQSLNEILSRISSSYVDSNFRIRSKRQRLLFSSNFSQ